MPSLASAAGAPNQLTGCVKAGEITKANPNFRPLGQKCPKGSKTTHLQTLPPGTHDMDGAINVGTTVSLHLSIPGNDLFGDDPLKGEEVVAEFGPFTISFGCWLTTGTHQWIVVRSDEPFVVNSAPQVFDLGGPLIGDGGESSFTKEFAIHVDLDNPDAPMRGPYFIDNEAGRAGHVIKIGLTLFKVCRAITEFTFFHGGGDRPVLHSHKRDNVTGIPEFPF